MKRLLTLLTLVILGAIAVRTQEPSPTLTRGSANGVAWIRSTHGEKVSYVNGAMDGYVLATYRAIWASCNVRCKEVPAWFNSSKNTAGATVKEMDTLYQDGAHASLRVIDVFIYAEMKLAGATKAELDDYHSRVKSEGWFQASPQYSIPSRIPSNSR